jgi:ribose transport system substrate-binding protein
MLPAVKLPIRPRAPAMVPAIALAFGLAFTGCHEKLNQIHAGSEQDPFVIGVSQSDAADPWRAQMNEDLKLAAARHPTLKLAWKDAGGDVKKQIAQIDELTAQGIDLLVVSPTDAVAIGEHVAPLAKHGTPVIALGRAVEESEATSSIGPDEKTLARNAGGWIAGTLQRHAAIIELVGAFDAREAKIRHEGLVLGLEPDKNTAIQILATAETKGLAAEAQRAAAIALKAQPAADLIVAHDDASAEGAALAVKAAGREVKIVSIGGLPKQGIEPVKQGVFFAAFTRATGGERAIEVALDALARKPVMRRITLGTKVYTKDNADKGGEEVEK